MKTSVCGLALGLMCLVSAPTVSQAADSSTMGGSMMNGNGMMMNHTNRKAHRQEMLQHHRRMMERRHKLQAKIRKQDKALQKLVEQMDNARGQKKTEVMAKLLTKMVHDRVALHKQMERMWSGQIARANRLMIQMSQNNSRK
ncbi:MAG TPA: hypothetical protein VKA67_03205 [Verrucomicrobiae bacterium]|nr:hypothetical protein [Verrucomicrobiae bacterium]